MVAPTAALTGQFEARSAAQREALRKNLAETHDVQRKAQLVLETIRSLAGTTLEAIPVTLIRQESLKTHGITAYDTLVSIGVLAVQGELERDRRENMVHLLPDNQLETQ